MLIYHTSDIHNRSGFAARIAELRAQESGIYVDCGDSLRGSQTMYHRDEPVIPELSDANLDVQAMGNREFHYVAALLAARARKMPYPLLCANIVDLRGRSTPFRAQHPMTSDDGRTVSFFGLLVPQYPVGSFWEMIFGIRFLDPISIAQQIVASAKPDDYVIALSHLGLVADRKLAAAIPRLDCILGGHSHDTLMQPEYIDGVPIIHAGPYARYLSKTRFSKTKGDRAVIRDFELVPLLASELPSTQ